MSDAVTPEVPDEGRAMSPAGPDTVPEGLAAPEAAGEQAPATAGAMIRRARQAQGLDAAALAAMLKIPARRLEALELGRHDELQSPTFERALAQAACRVLKIDPKPVLALLPPSAGNTLERVTEGLNTPFRERQGGSGGFGRGDGSPVLRPVVLVPVVLLIAAAAMLYMPTSVWTRLTHPIVAGAEPEAAASAPVAAQASAASDAVATVAGAGDAASAPSPGAGPAAPGAPVTPDATAPAASPAAAAASTTGVDEVLAHSEAAPNIPLQVVATADSWVEVLDAQGHPLLSRTVVAGESVGLDGAMPMRVKIGNASATRLTLRGDNVDLAPWTRDNVARLELK